MQISVNSHKTRYKVYTFSFDLFIYICDLVLESFRETCREYNSLLLHLVIE